MQFGEVLTESTVNRVGSFTIDLTIPADGDVIVQIEDSNHQPGIITVDLMRVGNNPDS